MPPRPWGSGAQELTERRLRAQLGAPGVCGVPVERGPQPGQVKSTWKNSPSYKSIVCEAGALTKLGDDGSEAIWCACSSLARGDFTGTLNFLDKELLGINGQVALAQITGSIAHLFQTALGAAIMLDAGFGLYTQRATAYI
jgi:hypothetical protein